VPEEKTPDPPEEPPDPAPQEPAYPPLKTDEFEKGAPPPGETRDE
jgi:hypothetical protein